MDKSRDYSQSASRRRFLKRMTLGSAVAVLPKSKAQSPSSDAGAQAEQERQRLQSKPFVGIQVGAVSFVDEGVERVLDVLQHSAGVNALMLAVFTYGRGIAGRQIPGQPLPDHGAQRYDTDTFHGGSYTAVHPEYYRNTTLRDFRAPDLGDFDLLSS